MKCINCGTDNNLQDRTANQGRCKSCNHPFAFEPTAVGTPSKMTDPFFAKVLADISVNDSLFFNEKQLLYLLNNRLKLKFDYDSTFGCLYPLFGIITLVVSISLLLNIVGLDFRSNIFYIATIIVTIIYHVLWILALYDGTQSSKLNKKERKQSAHNLKKLGFIILIIGGLLSLFAFKSFPLFVIAVCLGMLSIYLGYRPINQTELPEELIITPSQLQTWLNRWQEINGTNPKILPPPIQTLAPANINPDVTAYSFDRLIVCDRADIAQFLIANNFHFEHNCAILSIDRYPQNIFATTMQMLRRNPDLKIYTLHDCTPSGITLPHQLTTDPDWFANTNLPITDIGITPRQVLSKKRGMVIQSSSHYAAAAKTLPLEVQQNLLPEEKQWLEAGNYVELESLNPRQLIQILQRGITSNTFNIDSEDSNLMLIGDTGSFMYTSDSFG
ncbi:hypothetical protein [Calothrix sp. NIES-3974]|uniref:hypothetical protein n=1 Tax=Calothrix sp. NIES-3974 TaxID=2005462 RepID=UPI000B5F3AE9|nr:hypothetical protein [Calothrix sp. NIES-3974]BAZ03521.1 hypothetical protein NIES3974_01470 [Calothrix sp. NIES-3974]